MSLPLVRKALETALVAISPSLDTAWANEPFAPTADEPYQRAYLMPAEPEDLTMSGSVYWERGFLQVSLFYPLDEGVGDAEARAELLRAQFPRGATFESGGVVVTIRRTPTIFPGMTDEDRWMVPVRIPFSAQITRS